ncbi:hypothetical protein [Terrabacter sp. NPDC080008]|uniref:hypothetical protein n=1 Tax=Terrabacter sp. NPDC080008 TaxID=3155176 RepID=UPI00344B92A4
MTSDTAPASAAAWIPEDGWSVERRGSFVVGRCAACGFTTSARRARYSVETDMRAHASDCADREDMPIARTPGA